MVLSSEGTVEEMVVDFRISLDDAPLEASVE